MFVAYIYEFMVKNFHLIILPENLYYHISDYYLQNSLTKYNYSIGIQYMNIQFIVHMKFSNDYYLFITPTFL